MSDPNLLEVNPVVTDSAMDNSVLTQTPDVGVLYEQYRDLLLHVACRKFRVPDSDGENLMQEVFVAYMQTEAKIENCHLREPSRVLSAYTPPLLAPK